MLYTYVYQLIKKLIQLVKLFA